MSGSALLGDTGRLLKYPPLVGTYNYSTRRIWGLGDSITNGTVATPPGCAYRDGLSNQLIATGGFTGIQWVGSLQGGFACQVCPLNGQQMFNDGHSGFRCNDLLVILPGIFANAKPDVTLLHIGTNDLIAVLGGSETIGAAIASWNALFAAIIAEDPNGLFFVATLVPSPSLLGANMTAFNNNIVSQIAAASAGGTLIYECDQFNALDPATDFDIGGVHPLAAGYAKMAAKWYATLTTLSP